MKNSVVIKRGFALLGVVVAIMSTALVQTNSYSIWVQLKESKKDG